jgi:hypothetical protein
VGEEDSTGEPHTIGRGAESFAARRDFDDRGSLHAPQDSEGNVVPSHQPGHGPAILQDRQAQPLEAQRGHGVVRLASRRIEQERAVTVVAGSRQLSSELCRRDNDPVALRHTRPPAMRTDSRQGMEPENFTTARRARSRLRQASTVTSISRPSSSAHADAQLIGSMPHGPRGRGQGHRRGRGCPAIPLWQPIPARLRPPGGRHHHPCSPPCPGCSAHGYVLVLGSVTGLVLCRVLTVANVLP